MGNRVTVLALALLLVGCAAGTQQAIQSAKPPLPFKLELPPPALLESVRADSAAVFHGQSGSGFLEKSGNATVTNSDLHLDSAEQTIAWAIYDFTPVRLDLAASTLLITHTAETDGPAYIAFSNFTTNAWEFVTLDMTAGVNFEQIPIPQGSPFVRTQSGEDEGICFVAFIVWNNIDTTLNEIDLEMGVPDVAPQNLTASDGTAIGWIMVSWEPVDYAWGYLLEYKRSDEDDTAWVELSTPPGLPHYEYGHVYPGGPGGVPAFEVSYDYRVRTCFPDMDFSEYSNIDSGYRALPPPENLSATYNIYRDAIELNWDEVAGANIYYLSRRHYSGGQFDHVVETSATTYLDESLPDHDIYEYSVFAASPEGTSPAGETTHGSALGFSYSDFQTFHNTVPDIRMAEMTGKIAVAYFNTRFDDLYFAHATTLNPIGVSSWLHYDLNLGEVSGELCLGTLDNRPAIACRAGSSNHVTFTRCDQSVPLESPNWATTVLDDSGNADGRPSWVETDGKPALCIRTDPTDFTPGLHYYYSSTALPSLNTDWQEYTLDSSVSSGIVASMQIIDGTPSIIANNAGFSGYVYHDALQTSPTELAHWLTSYSNHTSNTARNIEMVVHNGLPFYAMSTYLYSDTNHWIIDTYRAHESPPTGSASWLSAGSIGEEGVDIGVSLDLAFINDRPAICYYDESAQDLKLALSKTTNPTSDDWVVNTVASGSNIGESCALLSYRGRPVLLYYAPISQKIMFANGE